VFASLHEDILKSCQKILFKSNQVYKSIVILIRVDCQEEDKDIRKKCKFMKNYSPLDLGVDPDFALFKGQTEKKST
jgi:hypothetical protein